MIHSIVFISWYFIEDFVMKMSSFIQLIIYLRQLFYHILKYDCQVMIVHYSDTFDIKFYII